MVSILMVNREKVSIRVIEFSSASCTDQTMDFEGALPVVKVGRGGLFHFLDEFVDGLVSTRLLCFWISSKTAAFHPDTPGSLFWLSALSAPERSHYN